MSYRFPATRHVSSWLIGSVVGARESHTKRLSHFRTTTRRKDENRREEERAQILERLLERLFFNRNIDQQGYTDHDQIDREEEDETTKERYEARDLRYYAELPGTDKQTKEYLEDKNVAVKALEGAMNSRKDYRRMFEHVVFAMQANTAVKNVFDKHGIKTKNDFLMFLANMARTSVVNFADINSDARKEEIFGSQEKYKKAYGLYDLLYTVGDTDSPIGDVARDPIDIFPWASDRKYVFFFKPKANSDILKLQDHSTHFTSEGEANRFIEKLLRLAYKNYGGQVMPGHGPETVVDDKFFSMLVGTAFDEMRDLVGSNKSNAEFYKAVKRLIMKRVVPYGNTKHVSLLLTSAFKMLGYEGIDDQQQVIYSEEPGQAVFFGANQIEIIDMISNDALKTKRLK